MAAGETAGSGLSLNVAGWLADAGLAQWKPVLTALAMPPFPFIALLLLGAWGLWRGRRGGLLLLLAGLALTWFSQCEAVAESLQRALLDPPPALTAAQRADLRARPGGVAVVVLGMGRESSVAEYDGAPDLSPDALQRWRYGQWLARELKAPLVFTGGIGHAGRGSASEAQAVLAAARRDGTALPDWTEDRSRDTRENARNTVALLARETAARRPGTLVIVTHGWHMPRALRAFRQAAAPGYAPQVVPAPMGLTPPDWPAWRRWTPSSLGMARTGWVLREKLGLWMGA